MQELFAAFFEMDSEVSTTSEDVFEKPIETQQSPLKWAPTPPQSPPAERVQQRKEDEELDPFADLDASSEPFFDRLDELEDRSTKRTVEDPKLTAVNQALDRQSAKLDDLNACLKRLDELTKYTDDLMSGIIGMNSEKVDELLENKKMNKKQHKCVYCNVEFNDSVAFMGHLMVRHMVSIKRIFCRICGAEFERPDELKTHIQKHFAAATTCPLCEDEEMSAEHEGTHPLEQYVFLKLSCDFCSYVTRDPDQYVVHNMLCTNNPQNENYEPSDEGRVCAVCKQVFGCNAYMLRHKRKKHTNAEDQNAVVNQFKCEDCGRRFGSMLSLGGHMKVHKREKNSDLIKFDKLKRPEDRQASSASAPPPKRRRTGKMSGELV